ncbi:Uncharacterized protein APZ42_025603 [Daphnia magna]|uniref:Reverse transcriptase domain-containing protein n=1 Tax=Daphnia magna TaxID=35525 RepID=A0A164SX93_9CRUS|nr:Uncharacterized protein APZ42_025603 [Daphnia magna]
MYPTVLPSRAGFHYTTSYATPAASYPGASKYYSAPSYYADSPQYYTTASYYTTKVPEYYAMEKAEYYTTTYAEPAYYTEAPQYYTTKSKWGAYTLTILRSFLAFKQRCRPTAHPTVRQALTRLALDWTLVKVLIQVKALFPAILHGSLRSRRRSPPVYQNGSKANILINPSLDESVMLRLKTSKGSHVTKANIDPTKKTLRKFSFKILDLAKPLLFLAGRKKLKRKSKSGSIAIKIALQLWATLLRDVIKTRRHNILSQVYPEFIGLLERTDIWSGGEDLFDRKILKHLVGEARSQATLEVISKKSKKAGSENGQQAPSTSREKNADSYFNSRSRNGSVFLVPKSSGGWHPIINLKALNLFIPHQHFKMEGVETVRHTVRQGDWLAKIDLEDAYLSVALNPQVFNKILKPIIAFLRQRGLRLVVYIDDILIVSHSRETAREVVKQVVGLFESLDFVIQEKKSIREPSQSLKYIGLVINTNTISFCLPTIKKEKLLGQCHKAYSSDSLPLRYLASLFGILNWASQSVVFAPAHYRNLQALFLRHLGRVDGDLSARVTFSTEVKQDLNWWMREAKFSDGRKILTSPPSMYICTDASISGWGAVSNEGATGGPWTFIDCKRHINELELLVAFNGLKCCASSVRQTVVEISIDNITTVSYINKVGGTRSSTLYLIALQIHS